MNVNELIEELKKHPGELEVLVDACGDFIYNRIKKVTFVSGASLSGKKRDKASPDVIVLTRFHEDDCEEK